jgi:hypothetical protein
LPSLRIMKLWRRKLSLRNPGTPSYQILAEIMSNSVIIARFCATGVKHFYLFKTEVQMEH